MADLTLITCTADRPEAFQLCERWMARQTYRGSIQWIVADGGETPANCTRGQQHLILGPEPDPLKNFRRNLTVALEHVESRLIAFIEDDDWHAPDWLEAVTGWLANADIAGEIPARYYNIASRRYHEHANGTHASLCQTAMRSSLLWPLFGALTAAPGPFIDRVLWESVAEAYRRRVERSRRVVGMKGISGHVGLGLGHATHHFGDRDDDTAKVLQQWVGLDSSAYNCVLRS